MAILSAAIRDAIDITEASLSQGMALSKMQYQEYLR